MHWRTRLIIASVVSLLAAPVVMSPAVATAAENDDTETSSTQEGGTDGESSEQETASQQEDEASDGAEQAEKRESEHGSYEYKRSYGAGIEYGGFFTDMGRWNQNLMEPSNAPTFDRTALHSFTLSVEASFLESTRLTAFAGFESAFSDNPGVSAIYGGLEPAFAFRQDQWELSIGMGVGAGKINVDTDNSGSFETGVIVLRPAIEVRRYFKEIAAVYARIGFNQWLPFNPDSNGLAIGTNNANAGPNVLNQGGPFLSIGARIGHYPKHKKTVPDTDGDGIRDDIDDCVNEPEDKDDWKDFDGCPDPDNEGQESSTSDDG
jgi:hypothetical protein